MTVAGACGLPVVPDARTVANGIHQPVGVGACQSAVTLVAAQLASRRSRSALGEPGSAV